MEIIGPILISTIAGLSTVLGGLIIFLKIKDAKINNFITFCLSLSLSVMISLSIIELIPESSYTIVKEYGLFWGPIFTFLAFILGFLMVNLVNKRLKCFKEKECNLYRVGVLSMVALMLHNLPEGIATFMTSYKDINLGISLGIAIMMHNIPEGISIAVPIFYSTKSRGLALKNTLLSGLAEPLGAILAYIFLHKYINDTMIAFVLMLVSGIMVTLSINELLPQAISYKKPKYIYLGLIFGIILVIINHFVF